MSNHPLSIESLNLIRAEDIKNITKLKKVLIDMKNDQRNEVLVATIKTAIDSINKNATARNDTDVMTEVQVCYANILG